VPQQVKADWQHCTYFRAMEGKTEGSSPQVDQALLRDRACHLPQSLAKASGAMASNIKVAVIESPSAVSLAEALGPARTDSPIESLSQAPSAKASPMSVVIKGLPADHSLSKCMGEYVEHARRIADRPAFAGGRCNDMLLSFSNSLGWEVRDKEDELFALLYSKGSEALPQLTTSGWTVCKQRKHPSSVRVEKFKKRETMLKLSGGQGSQLGAYFEGVYRKQANSHDSKPMYCNVDKAIWFVEGFGWCVGFEEDIGTQEAIGMHADDFAPTPDVVQSDWMVLTDSVDDPRVQVVLASAEHNPSLMGQHCTPAPVLSLSIPDPTALEDTQHPAMLTVVGIGEGYSGLYEKQQRRKCGKVLYKSRDGGKRAMYYYSPVADVGALALLEATACGAVLSAQTAPLPLHTLLEQYGKKT
jgi:hypothetical protein